KRRRAIEEWATAHGWGYRRTQNDFLRQWESPNQLHGATAPGGHAGGACTAHLGVAPPAGDPARGAAGGKNRTSIGSTQRPGEFFAAQRSRWSNLTRTPRRIACGRLGRITGPAPW